MTAYYNEFDTFAAAWLRELIKAKVIAEGEVDERSIEDVTPGDLRGYTQCHFFAGIGVWSYALRLAGWPDSRPVWTGSCPCQPFSNAGKRDGFADKRHLWPAWFHLISQCKPDVIFGEQVKAAISQGWLDLVQDDLEGIGYSFGAVPFPACSVGAPHIRQRVYFVGHSQKRGYEGRSVLSNGESPLRITQTGLIDGLANPKFGGRHNRRGLYWGYSEKNDGVEETFRSELRIKTEGDSATVNLGDSDNSGLQGRGLFGTNSERNGGDRFLARPSGPDGLLAHADGGVSSDGNIQRSGQHGFRSQDSGACGVADTTSAGLEGSAGTELQGRVFGPSCGGADILLEDSERTTEERFGQYRRTMVREQKSDGFSGPSSTSGFWRDADWLYCTDKKYRPVEPGTFPLVNGAANRVGRLRGYGNAIVAPQAQAFIEAYLEVIRAGN